MAELGKYTLIKINGDVISAQMDSTLSFTSGIIETTEISGANRFKTFEYDEKEGDCSVSVQKDDAIEGILFNAWYNSTIITVWYGGINNGEKYFLFDALITGISKNDPNTGISMLSLSLKPTGLIQRLTVGAVTGVWSLTITNTGDGTTNVNPNKTLFDDGENVVITASPNPGSAFWRHFIGGSYSDINPLSLLMDGNKAIEFIYGKITFDYTFNAASINDWLPLPSLPPSFDVDFNDITGLTVSTTVDPASHNYANLLKLNFAAAGIDPVLCNRIKIYFDSTDFGFMLLYRNSLIGEVFSTYDIQPVNEPIFIKSLPQSKYIDELIISATTYDVNLASINITRIVLELV